MKKDKLKKQLLYFHVKPSYAIEQRIAKKISRKLKSLKNTKITDLPDISDL